MEVRIVQFPETNVAVVEHHGPPALEYQSSGKLIEWRKANGVSPVNHQTFGVHYTDPQTTPPAQHRVDFCVTYDQPVALNPQGVIHKVIPACRCALARHLGSRAHNAAAVYLYQEWLPQSGEAVGEFPIFFHYVNVGPQVQEAEMITDVYLPLRSNANGSMPSSDL